MAVSAPVECGFGSLFKRAVSCAESAVRVAMAQILPNLSRYQQIAFMADVTTYPYMDATAKPLAGSRNV